MLPSAAAWAATSERPHHALLGVVAVEGLEGHARDFLLAHEDAFRRGTLEPDRLVNPFNHTLDPQGHGGADDFVQAEFNDARASLASGDTETGAYELGELAHVIMDLAQPMHTAGGNAIANPHHTNYENATADHAGELDLTTTPNVTIESARAAALHLATRSAQDYEALTKALDAEDHEWSPEVARITQERLRDGIATTRMLLQQAFDARVPDGSPAESVRPTPGPAPLFVVLTAMALAAARKGSVTPRRFAGIQTLK